LGFVFSPEEGVEMRNLASEVADLWGKILSLFPFFWLSSLTVGGGRNAASLHGYLGGWNDRH
jgi:hypothetical protein